MTQAGRFVIAGGAIHDPATGRDGVIDDVFVVDGRVVARPADPRGFARVDARGLVVMPGGVDLHSHVAGPQVCAGRRVAPRLARGRDRAVAAVPTIHATGALYAALGYTTVFDAAIPCAAADLAHLELAELPILDKGVYLLAADRDDVLGALAANAAGETARLLGDVLAAGRGWAVKVADPGGTAFWKHGRRGDHHDLDTPLPGRGALTPRLVLERLAEGVGALGLPHPLHVHTANLGLPGNWRTMLETMRSLAGRRGHLAHVQFHSYAGGRRATASSRGSCASCPAGRGSRCARGAGAAARARRPPRRAARGPAAA